MKNFPFVIWLLGWVWMWRGLDDVYELVVVFMVWVLVAILVYECGK